MKKKLIAALIALSCLPAIPPAMAAAADAVFDDFESYDITEGAPFTGTGTRINDNWSILNGGYNNNMRVSVKDYSGNKKLAVNGSGGEGVIIYTGDTSGITGDAVMEADMKVTDWNGRTGLRFLMSSDGKSYYQLYAKEGENVILSKHVNGTQQSSVVVKEGWGTEGWAHIKMEMKDSKLTLYYTKGATTIEKSIEDDTPLTAQGSLTTCAFLDGQNESVFDNFSYKKYDSYIDGQTEPNSVFYRNAAYGAAASGGEYALDTACRVRKVQLYSDAPSSLAGAQIILKNADGAVNMADVAAENITAFGAELLNTATKDEYTAVEVRTSAEITQLKAFTDIENNAEFTYAPGANEYLAEFGAHFKDGTAVWSSSDDTILSVNDGALIPHAKGNADISVTDGTTTYTAKITVLGEIDTAIEQGRIDEYILAKKPIVDGINNAIRSKNVQDIETALGTLSQIFDFSYERVRALSSEQLTKLAARMAEYAPFCAEDGSYTVDDLLALMDTVYLEIKVGDMCGKTAQEIEEAILAGNEEYYKLNLTKTAWKTYKANICAALANREYKSHADLTKIFNDTSVMTVYANTISADLIGAMLTEYAAEIGYNTAHYNSITNKVALNEALVQNKAALTSAELIRNYIDTYTAPAPTPVPVNPGGGGGGSGGGKVSTPGGAIGSKVTVPNPTQKPAEEIEEEKNNTYLYTDLNGTHWAYDAVKALSVLGVIKGYEDGSFMPEKTVTRGEFARMLASMFRLEANAPQEGEEQKFPDVDKNAWYCASVDAVYDNGIACGDANGNFNPESEILREEMAVMINRIIENKGLNVSEKNTAPVFGDSADISDWAYRAVIKLGTYGIISGDDSGNFRPHAGVTRAEAAQALSLVMQQKQ